MEQFRVEHDLLGEMKVPAAAYYGIHTLRAVQNFQISGNTIGEDAFFVRGLALVKKACALANGELGTIPKDVSKSIVEACDEVLKNPKAWAAQFPSDVFQGVACTSVNMNANEVIANIALEKRGLKKGD